MSLIGFALVAGANPALTLVSASPTSVFVMPAPATNVEPLGFAADLIGSAAIAGAKTYVAPALQVMHTVSA